MLHHAHQRFASTYESLRSMLDDDESKTFLVQVLREEHDYLRNVVDRANDIDPSIPRSEREYVNFQLPPPPPISATATIATIATSTTTNATSTNDHDDASLLNSTVSESSDVRNAAQRQLDALLSLQSPPPSQQASTQPPATPPMQEQIRDATALSQRNPIVERETAFDLLGVWHHAREYAHAARRNVREMRVCVSILSPFSLYVRVQQNSRPCGR
jgi:hypothetical protein